MPAPAVLSPRSTRTVAYSRLGDEFLAGRAAAGNSAAFSALYERYHGPLLGYCRSILLNAEDASDATQSALENALRALPRREPGRPLKPWLYRIAHNEAINIVRRRQPQVELDSDAALAVPGPEVNAETRGRLSQLVIDLRELPERQRGALVMRELSGLSYDEIGAALGVTNEAARRAVFDARSALHELVDGRATACISVRHKLSDGDRRSLRARGIRAHLRSCDACASFERSITVRRGDLHAIGCLPGATGLGLLGGIGVAGGAGGAGGGALIVAGGGSAVAGGGLGWASVPVAVKGLAVAAALAGGGGAAAVEVRHITKDSSPAPRAQAAAARRAAPALAAASAAASSAASLKAAASSAAHAHAGARARSSARARPHPAASPTPEPAGASAQAFTPAPAATTATTPVLQTKSAPAPAARREATKSAVQIAIDKLTMLREQVRRAYEHAQATAAAGTTESIATANTTLQRTLDVLRPLLERVLATVGLKLPADTAAPPTPAPKPTPTNILQPVEHVLGGVNQLLQTLFSRPLR
ncbi:MAG TPA: RNA polymerase sigma factor [Solirubrobacteraceae bacterium]